ncbi:hypothetical protein ACLOJK_021187 [Asimina triloba]
MRPSIELLFLSFLYASFITCILLFFISLLLIFLLIATSLILLSIILVDAYNTIPPLSWKLDALIVDLKLGFVLILCAVIGVAVNAALVVMPQFKPVTKIVATEIKPRAQLTLDYLQGI